MIIQTINEILPSETILEDDYPIYEGYAYILDDKHIISSDIGGNIGDLKRLSGAKVVRRCELVRRRLI